MMLVAAANCMITHMRVRPVHLDLLKAHTVRTVDGSYRSVDLNIWKLGQSAQYAKTTTFNLSMATLAARLSSGMLSPDAALRRPLLLCGQLLLGRRKTDLLQPRNCKPGIGAEVGRVGRVTARGTRHLSALLRKLTTD